jgi:3-isopropylmalate dehydrogenase
MTARSSAPSIAVIAGDGIGPEVIREATRVLELLGDVLGQRIQLSHYPYGADEYLRTGVGLPEGALAELRQHDAILFGAVGDPRIPDMRHGREILLRMRFELDLFINYRPVKLLDERLCPLKGRGIEDIDFVVLRENTEGLYVGMGGIFKKDTPDEIAIQEDINTRKGVERVLVYAFETARAAGRKEVVMSDKSNVLIYGHDLWQRCFRAVAARHPEISARHLFVDALVMQMVKDPAQFEVIVTCNMFGDIITDLGAQLQGGLGVAASGNLNPAGVSLFEPIHGSAPKYAGKGVANPFGAILSAQLMLEHLGMKEAGQLIERAVVAAIRSQQTTPDLGGMLTTEQAGAAVREELRRAL